MNKSKYTIKFLIIILILFFLIIWDFRVGYIKPPISEIFNFFNIFSDTSEEYLSLFKDFRFPRVFSAILAGAALSVAGLIMQTLFRNPLADSYILGISSGASLGVALVVLGTSTIIGLEVGAYSNSLRLIAAGAGAAVILAIILSVSARVRDILSILIIGILVSGVVNSIVSILQYYANDINVKSYIVWTMGSLNSVSFNEVIIMTPIVLVTILGMFSLSKYFNLLLPGDSFAKSMGVNISAIRIFSFICISILTGAVTAFCGPIGFIGIAAPHIARWIFNTSNHFILIPASMLMGSMFLLCGDLLTHIISSKGILPINAITSILGAPFIIWIVIKNKRTIV